MNKKKISLSILVFLFPVLLFSQITPDSLIGTYAGERWFKWEEDTEWAITIDSAFVISVNESNCSINTNSFLGGPYFETSYDFCYGDSDNWFTRFHSGDSVMVIYNDISQPPPNFHLYSIRYYGKKISSDILINTENIDPIIKEVKIYPNPFVDYIKVDFQSDTNNDCLIKIFNMDGKEIDSPKLINNNQAQINTRTIKPGFYTLQIIQNNSIKTYKAIKI